jgi:histidyl-tRNA synthetase
VVLAELLRDRGLVPAPPHRLDAFVAAVTPDDLPHVLALAHALRDAGYRVQHALGAQALGKQLKDADARGARTAVVIGPDDRARGEVQLKDLATKSQQAVGRVALVGALAAIVGPPTNALPPQTSVAQHG